MNHNNRQISHFYSSILLISITKTIQACKIGNGFENFFIFFENNFFRVHKPRSPPIVYE